MLRAFKNGGQCCLKFFVRCRSCQHEHLGGVRLTAGVPELAQERSQVEAFQWMSDDHQIEAYLAENREGATRSRRRFDRIVAYLEVLCDRAQGLLLDTDGKDALLSHLGVGRRSTKALGIRFAYPL